MVNTAAILVSTAVVLVLSLVWQSDALNRPENDHPLQIAVGIADAPADTRVFVNADPWNDLTAGTMRLVIGQSRTEPPRMARFRVEVGHPVADIDGSRCQGQLTTHTCWYSEGPASLVETEIDRTIVLSGTFVSSGGLYVDLRPLFGAGRNGPYSSFHAEIGPSVAEHGFTYPARGVEIEVTTGVGSIGSRYESFFPADPYRLYPGGWAWLLPSPGGPVGAQIVDIQQENHLRRISDIAGLLIGVFLALAVQATYELVRNDLRLQRRAPAGR